MKIQDLIDKLKDRLLLVIFLLISLLPNSHAIFGIDKVMADLSLVKVKVAEHADALAKFQTDVNASFNIQNKMIANIKNDIRAEVHANAQAQAAIGSNNSASSIGGNQSISNDSGMIIVIFRTLMSKMELIIASFFTFLLSLMGGVWAMLKFQSDAFNKALDAKDKHVVDLMTMNVKMQEQQDTWQNSVIERLIIPKKEG